ncbi:transposase [Streptomyces sp. NPDC002795]|uniref:transposase n=1 Tax=Streptomyces sp. NPDC002795 TaxID=3364665 RepID=UPI00368B30CA
MALGADTGISKSEVARICGALDEPLAAFRTRPLDHTRFPCIYLDAAYCKARVEHQIASRAVVIAAGITEDGGREAEMFWREFLRHLRERGPWRGPSGPCRSPRWSGRRDPQGDDRRCLPRMSGPLSAQRLPGAPEGCW